MSDETKQRPRIITVASGKGGVGKTSFCVNLAIALSQFGKRVLIADADFGLSNVDVMLGVMTKYNIAHFLRGQRTMDEIVQIGYDGVRFISGGTGADDLLGITPEQLDEVIAGFSGIEMPLDYIICDAGAGIGEAVIKLAQASDEIFAVLTPEPTSATDAYALIKYVQRRAPDRQISIVMNRVTNMRDSEGIAGGFTDMIYRTQGRRVDTLGFIREDTGVPASIRNQTPHMVGAPASKFSLDVKVIARILLGLPPLREQTGFFRRIFTRASYAILGEESADVQDSGYGRFRTERVVSDFVENQLAASRSASADPFPARAERSANDPPEARVVEEAARIFSEISPPTAKPEVRPEPQTARPAPESAAKPAIKPLSAQQSERARPASADASPVRSAPQAYSTPPTERSAVKPPHSAPQPEAGYSGKAAATESGVLPKPERQTSAGDSAGQADNEAEIFKLLDGLSQPPPAARPAEAAPGPAIKPPAQSAPQPDRTAEPAAKPPQSGGDFMSILESIMDE